MDAADAFVRVAAADDEARDLAVDLAVEVGEDGGRQLCAVSVGECYGGGPRCCGAGASSPRCAASTVCRRLCAPFCLISSCLPARVSVRAPCRVLSAESFLTSSGALGRCGPTPTRGRSAAPSCLLHLKRAAEEEGSFRPSIERKTPRCYVYAGCVVLWKVADMQRLGLPSDGPTSAAHRAPYAVVLAQCATNQFTVVTHAEHQASHTNAKKRAQ